MAFIGLTTGVTERGGVERMALNAAYLEAVQMAGAVPVILPPQLGPHQFADLAANLDGLILTGGGDVDPARYNEKPHRETTGVSQKRDEFEVAALRWALGEHRPVLAICRGMQIMNVALGGSLYQHVPESFGDAINHSQAGAGFPRCEATHAVEVRGGSLLANIIGSGSVGVNSMHHQSVRAAGSHLVITARAPDGVIEAVEGPSLGAFVLGVQWHPEEMIAGSGAARSLFIAFVNACGEPQAARMSA